MDGYASVIGYAVIGLAVAFVIGIVVLWRARRAERRRYQRSGYTRERPWWAGR